MPVAFNCSVSPCATDGLIGVIETALRAAAVTTSVALAVCDPEMTVMVVEPGAAAVATPVEGSIVATAALLECHPSGATSAPRVECVPSDRADVAAKSTACVATATGAPG